MYRRAVEQGGVAAYGQSVALNPLLIAFPLLALVGGLLLLARVLSLLLPLLRRVSGGWPTAGWLTVRRMVGSAAITLGVFVLAAVPLGVLAYSDGLTGSLLQTVAAKAGTYTGSEAALDLRAHSGREPTPDLHGEGTFVNVVRAGRANASTIALLGIEPDVFGSFASWDDAAVGGTRAQLLGALAGADHNGAVPAILVGAPENTTVDTVRLFRTDVPIRVVASARTFPGRRAPGEPMLVVDRTDLHDRDRYADRQIEVWTDDSHLSAVLSQLNDQGVQVERRRTPDSFFGAVDLLPITWTFGYLEIIAALTGLIAATALLLYLAARQRQRVSAFHLGRRMGITDASHLRSLLLEVAAVLVGAWLAGSTLGLLCVELAYRLLDLNPTFPPQPLFDLPVGLLGRSVLAVAVATVLIGALAHVAARRTEAGSVLRVD